MAERLAVGNEIPLEKYLLGSVYHLMHQVSIQLLKNEPVHTIRGPWWLIQHQVSNSIPSLQPSTIDEREF